MAPIVLIRLGKSSWVCLIASQTECAGEPGEVGTQFCMRLAEMERNCV